MSKKLRCVEDTGIVELAEGLKIISDPNRLRIVCLLLRGERCVCEVEQELEISQQLASHHLNVLKESGLLKARRVGTSSYYSVVEERLDRITDVFMRYLSYRARHGEKNDVICCTPASAGAQAGRGRVSRRGGGGR